MGVKDDWAGGELLFCGGTDWAMIGRGGGGKNKADDGSRQDKYPNLVSPTRLTALKGIRVSFIAAGPAACHSIIGSVDGRVFTWGRNERGQLGHGDLRQRNSPTEVAGLKGKHIIGGAGGKFHSLVVTQAGQAYSFGSNLQGQCGTGSIKSKPKQEEMLLSPALAQVSGCSAAAAGAEFSMWLCEGQLWSAGLPQYGQLGHGTDHEYNAKDSSIKICYEPQPKPRLIAKLAGVTVRAVACGPNHTLALDTAGGAWTWGCGGYGRLGHTKQADEMAPKQLEVFAGRNVVPQDSVAACATSASFCCGIGGSLHAWGKWKTSGDNTMYPKMFQDLAGWTIRHMACGSNTYAVAAEYGGENSTITWGQAQHGELGYGPHGRKSAANPDKCNALEGVYVHQVACGIGHTMFLADPDSDKVAALEEWGPEVEVEDAPAGAPSAAPGAKGAKGKAAAGKRKAEPAAPKAKKGKA